MESLPDNKRKRRLEKMMRAFRASAGGFAVLVVLSLALAMGLTGCGSSSSDNNSPEVNAFVGTWALYGGDTIQGSIAWYVNFREDGTYNVTMNADGTGQKVYGTYTVTDGALVGPFTNPRVGEGRVEATITNGVMHLDFIEYWHTPNKVVPYTGSKL
jgi:major membrane immunogen (membrane-anchored lipoprotein)